MKIEIHYSSLVMLEMVKGKMLLSTEGNTPTIYVVEDFTVTKEIETPEITFFNKRPKSKQKIYITDAKILTYNSQGNFAGYLTQEGCGMVIGHYDLYKLRNKWVEFVGQLKEFGFEITKIKEKIKEESI